MRMRARLEAALLTRPPRLLHALLPGCEWAGPRHTPAGAPILYLTFDDGPIPEETPWVLAQLAEFDAKATFFCVGENLVRYPEIARAALEAGHRLGNHTQRHLSGWATTGPEYLADIATCQAVIDELEKEVGSPLTATVRRPLFRAPYGRLTWPLLQKLTSYYRLIMWSVLTRDYNPDLSPDACLHFTLAAAQPGDVLVFHDSRKASARLRQVLPGVLAHFATQGFQFLAL